jgi:hypothetical protein
VFLHSSPMVSSPIGLPPFAGARYMEWKGMVLPRQMRTQW